MFNWIDWAALWHGTVLTVQVATLLLVNTAGVLLVALQLPGTWLILFATALAAWWRWEQGTFGWWTLASLLVLALLGELVEFLGSMLGAKVAGAGRRAAWLALLGSIIGAIVGTFTIPIPIVGTLIGAAIGAAIGSITGDRWSGRQWHHAFKGGGGAAVGRFSGALGKLIIAVLMWLVVVAAMVF